MTKNQRNEYLRTLASGETAIAEIIAKVAAGQWMLIDSKYTANLLQRRPENYSMHPGSGWVPVKGYHPMTVHAAKARLARRFSTQWSGFVYEVAA